MRSKSYGDNETKIISAMTVTANEIWQGYSPSVTPRCHTFSKVTLQITNNLVNLNKLFSRLVETAGIEPASASPLPLALHAYSDFNLTTCYPPDGEDMQLARYLFSALAPNKPPSRFYESDAGMFRRTWTHRHVSSPTAIYRSLSGDSVVVIVCNYNLQKV